MKIKKISILSGKTNIMDIPLSEDELKRIIDNRDPIQTIVPHLNAEQREFLISGITPEEWESNLGHVEE